MGKRSHFTIPEPSSTLCLTADRYGSPPILIWGSSSLFRAAFPPELSKGTHRLQSGVLRKPNFTTLLSGFYSHGGRLAARLAVALISRSRLGAGTKP
jgi:hypothetical protein